MCIVSFSIILTLGIPMASSSYLNTHTRRCRGQNLRNALCCRDHGLKREIAISVIQKGVVCDGEVIWFHTISQMMSWLRRCAIIRGKSSLNACTENLGESLLCEIGKRSFIAESVETSCY